MKTILLVTGWQTINIGDIGHTCGTLRVLEDYLPDVRVIAWMHAIHDGIEAMLNRRFPNVSIVRGGYDAEGEPNTPGLKQALADADLVVHNTAPGP